MENSIIDRKRNANSLRKNGQFIEATKLYEVLWNETGDVLDGSGLLHCYRKLGLFDKALPFAKTLSLKFANHNWLDREICWTLIQGRILKYNEKTPLNRVHDIARVIFNHNPDELARKITVLKVLRLAKKVKNWELVSEWIDKIDVDHLSSEPINASERKGSWSEQAIWYNNKINSLIYRSQYAEADRYAKIAGKKFPYQKRFFDRLTAISLKEANDLPSAEKIYHELYNNQKADWWIIAEYGSILKAQGKLNQALKLLCEAANSCKKLETMVNLILEIADLCLAEKMNVEAYAHLALIKFIKEEKEWRLTEDVRVLFQETEQEIPDQSKLCSKNKALERCRKFWDRHLTAKPSDERRIKKNQVGQLSFTSNKQFCFIQTKENLSAICYQSDLLEGLKNGTSVLFDAIPSFDKKKNRPSWKAKNVRPYNQQ